jgi:hypothetical protein
MLCGYNKIDQIDEMEGLEWIKEGGIGEEYCILQGEGLDSEGLKGLFFVSAKPNQ